MSHVCALGAVFGACLLAAGSPAAAQGRADGVYPGLLACDALPFGRGAVRDPVSLTIANGEARYSRKLSGADGAAAAGKTESGSGKVTGGQLVLVGSARGNGFSYEARYAGTVDGRGGFLTGSQTWTYRGGSHRRGCQMSVGGGRR